MEKFVPYEKLSKKKKKELNAKRRQTWGINPVTRRPENPKAYNRKKARKRDLEDFPDALSSLFCYCTENNTVPFVSVCVFRACRREKFIYDFLGFGKMLIQYIEPDAFKRGARS